MHFILGLLLFAVAVPGDGSNVSCGEQPRVLRSPALVAPAGGRAFVEVQSVSVRLPDQKQYPFLDHPICSNTAILYVAETARGPFRPALVVEPRRGLEEGNIVLGDWSADGRYLLGKVVRDGLAAGCAATEEHPFLYDAVLKSFIYPGLANVQAATVSRGCEVSSLEPLGFSSDGSVVIKALYFGGEDGDQCREGSQLWQFRPESSTELDPREAPASITQHGRVVEQAVTEAPPNCRVPAEPGPPLHARIVLRSPGGAGRPQDWGR